MLKEILRKSGVFGKLLQLLFIVFFFGLISTAVLSLIYGASQDIQVLKIKQLVLSIFMFLLPPLVAGYFWFDKPIEAYSLHRAPATNQLIATLLLVVGIVPFINLLGYINEQMVLPPFLASLEQHFRELEDLAAELTSRMLDVKTFGGFAFNILLIALMPALSEELLCRGAMYRVISEKFNLHVAVWLVAVIFSLMHFQMYGFLPRMVLGAVLGYLLVWSGSLWLPIIAHFANNAMVVSSSYFSKGTDLETALEQLGKAETYGMGIAGALVSILLMWYIYKKRVVKVHE